MSPFIDTMQWVVEEPTEEDSHAYLERVIEDKRQELKMNVLDSIRITNPLGHEIGTYMNERKMYEIFAKNALVMIDSKGFLPYKSQYLAIKEKYDVGESKFAALSNKIVPLIEIRQAIELRVPETYSRDTASMSVEEMLELISILDEDIKVSSEMTYGYCIIRDEWHSQKVELIAEIKDCVLRIFGLAQDLHLQILASNISAK